MDTLPSEILNSILLYCQQDAIVMSEVLKKYNSTISRRYITMYSSNIL